jgi:DNA-binding transcriptional MerR regulator
MDTRNQARIQARISQLKSLGVPVDSIEKIVKSENPDQADEIELVDPSGAGFSMNNAPSSLRASDHTAIAREFIKELDQRDYNEKVRQAELERQEFEQAEKAEFREELASIKQAVARTDVTVLSHLVDHQLVQDGQRQALSVGKSIQFLLAGRDQKTRSELLKGFGPEEIEALELAECTDSLALPASENAGEKVVDVVQKKPGIFGFGR